MTRYVLGGPGMESTWGANIFASVQTGPSSYPASRKMAPAHFPMGNVAMAWRLPPTPSNTDVKERVELYTHSPFGPSWSLQKSTLPFTLHCRQTTT